MENEHPASMTARAMKQTLPDRAIVTRDARIMVNTATSMFTLYLSTIAHDISTKNKRSTITLKDVLAALRETEFEHFVEPVEQCLLDTKALDARKRARKDAQKAEASAEGERVDGGGGELETRTVEESMGDQAEVPMDTDADLDGDPTIDEDDEVEEIDEGEDTEEEVSGVDGMNDLMTTTGDTVENSVDAIEDTVMEETKSSDE